MKKFLFPSVVVVSVLLVGCNDKTYTVKDFYHNEALRSEYVLKCNNGELKKDDLNCENSSKAEFITKTMKRLEKNLSEATDERTKKHIQDTINELLIDYNLK
ncbi:EexN family lipoprotein [Gallibacterium anatis]|uniref:EexN family lipoprotein n=1 Tax=Gallibacterium anatis TaxID=750 RepID=UPI003006CF4C